MLYRLFEGIQRDEEYYKSPGPDGSRDTDAKEAILHSSSCIRLRDGCRSDSSVLSTFL